jgi:oligoribonuclease NrnB/cAMP/cGMP phosphodiesterase (DHH superfamily)
MRIVTRGDFDGLSSSVLLTEVEQIREIRFVHPKDAQDATVTTDAEDIVVNLPYVPGCGLWFDHHISEKGKQTPLMFKGRFEMAPSCARVIYNYYRIEYPDRGVKLERFMDLLEATDRLDSAELTPEDVAEPKGWILLGLTLDPRSGLGPEFRKYFRWLVEYLKEVPIEKVLQHPEVKKRAERVLNEQEQHKALLKQYSKLDGNVVVTDFRGLRDKPVGNRFLVYTVFPSSNGEVRLFDGHQGAVVVAVGRSIFNRSCRVNVGRMLSEFGGGGHVGAGTAQLKPGDVGALVGAIIDRLKENEG